MDILNKPIGWVISLCYKLIPNYAVALLLFAIVMKLLLFPFGIKQQKNMLRQAKLRPKERAIRNRYAGRDDKVTQQKMQEDLMKLYQDEGYNPASGCLPMILQLVIVFVVYAVMRSPLTYINNYSKAEVKSLGVRVVELYKEENIDLEGVVSDAVLKNIKTEADKIGKDGEKVNSPFQNDEILLVRVIRMNDIEKFITTEDGDNLLPVGTTHEDLPNFYLFGNKADLSKYPSMSEFNWYLLVPLLTFVFTFGSMKLTKKLTYQSEVQQQTADAGCSMKIMDYMMPLMSTFITFSVPTIIAVYWIYGNVLSLLQQVVLKFMYPIPVFTEEDYKQAEIEMNKGVKHHKKKANATKRAAHRIDLDEDAVIEEKPKAGEKKAKADPKASLIAPAQIKDESDKNSDND